MKKKINVRFALKKEFDFGLFPIEKALGELKNIDYDFWEEYIKARYDFDMLHHKLEDMIGLFEVNKIHENHKIISTKERK